MNINNNKNSNTKVGISVYFRYGHERIIIQKMLDDNVSKLIKKYRNISEDFEPLRFIFNVNNMEAPFSPPHNPHELFHQRV